MDAATCTELKNEQALAKRWLRTGLLPLPVWQWLAGHSLLPGGHLPAARQELVRALAAFAVPIGIHSSEHERQALKDCLDTVAQLLTLGHSVARGPALACLQRMFAASLLPLYRGLARGSVAEVTSVLRRQMADAIALHAVLVEFSEDLPELLSSALADDQSPYTKLKNALQVELNELTQHLLTAASKWDGTELGELSTLVREDVKLDWRPAWGQPAVLWRLAGELIAQRAEFVVPRDWIDVPVPWNEASQHWLDIVHALEQPNPGSLKVAQLGATDASKCLPATTGSTVNSSTIPENVTTASSSTSSTATSTVSASTVSASSTEPGAVDSASPSAALSTTDVLGDDIARLKLEIEIADTVDSLVQASRTAAGNAGGNRADESHAGSRPRGEEFVVPKIIIAEVRSHNDPAFVSVARRQLALCRSEERCMSLLAVRVSPDGEEDQMPTLQSLGLASWQQKLVNWMSEHPEIHEPYAFVSNEGELILSLMDIERNTATLILRQGLTSVLSGAMTDDSSLSRAAIPARYHAGIGSVSSPTASFEPEQLIAATYRCLEAATRHGKASIKSIEVF